MGGSVNVDNKNSCPMIIQTSKKLESQNAFYYPCDYGNQKVFTVYSIESAESDESLRIVALVLLDSLSSDGWANRPDNSINSFGLLIFQKDFQPLANCQSKMQLVYVQQKNRHAFMGYGMFLKSIN